MKQKVLLNSSKLSSKFSSEAPINKTEYVSLITDLWLERQRSQDAILSFLCIIFLMALMIGLVWYYGLFHRRPKKFISIHDEDPCHYTTVNQLIRAKKKLLPMFKKKIRKKKKIVAESDASVDTDYEDF